jgi:hypothetical protein
MLFYADHHVNVRGLHGKDGIDWAAYIMGEFTSGLARVDSDKNR